MSAKGESGTQRARPHGLGRGLSALLGEAEREAPVAATGADHAGIRMVPVARIAAHPKQPRRHFDDDALSELAASIAERGVIQPLIVRPRGRDYQIVAGERRWRAAQKAQLHEVPVIVRDFDDAESLEIALVENIQREDLNAIEEAEAYHRLIGDYGHSQEELARLVHKSRSHVANILRLLDLPKSVRDMVASGLLSMGHGRALIGSPDALDLARSIIADGLTVRQTEELVRRSRQTKPTASAKADKDADIAALESRLGEALGVRVSIAHRGRGGALRIGYSSLDQLDLICRRLTGHDI